MTIIIIIFIHNMMQYNNNVWEMFKQAFFRRTDINYVRKSLGGKIG